MNFIDLKFQNSKIKNINKSINKLMDNLIL